MALFDVMLALAMLSTGALALAGVTTGLTRAVALGHRWAVMAEAAEAELVRLEREYRTARPLCVLPAPGSRFTPDGVSLGWRVSGDSVTARVGLEVRAMASRRIVADSITTTLSCR